MADCEEVIPPQYDLNAKWDACLDLTVRRFVYSSLGGAFGGLLLFRRPLATISSNFADTIGKLRRDFIVFVIGSKSAGSPMTRWASVACGAGVGIGSAYTECSRLFEGSPAKLAAPKIIEVPAPQDGHN